MARAELTEHVMVRFTPDQLAAVRKQAEDEGMTTSQLVRKALKQWLATK